MTDEIVYAASMEVLLREGFAVKKDNCGRHQSIEHDAMVIEKLIEFSKHDAMKLEKAVKMIAQRLKIANPNTETEEFQETNLIPFQIQQQLQQ
ncbi:hypothetical protein ACVWY4_005546 [Bacillus mycoides]